MGQRNNNYQSNFHFITIPGEYRESVTEKNEGIIMKLFPDMTKDMNYRLRSKSKM